MALAGLAAVATMSESRQTWPTPCGSIVAGRTFT